MIEVRQLREVCQHLNTLSLTDPLTGLYNFRHFFISLDQEMERSRRSCQPMGLLMIDLDHFKNINDSYGHQAGDAALRQVGEFWRHNIRRIDIACRYGGEEFALILPNANLTQAIAVARRLRNKLALSPLRVDQQEIQLTASFGIDIYVPKETVTPENLVKRVDTYLLAAKAMGRNCISHREVGLPAVSTGLTAAECRLWYGKPQTD